MTLFLALLLALGLASQAQAQVSFNAAVNFATGVAPNAVAVGDFDRDGDLDLAVTNQANNDVRILLGVGDGTFNAAAADPATGAAPNAVAVGDLDRDGDLDLAVVNEADDTVSILLGDGMGAFGAKTDFGTGFTPNAVAIADLNGDGKLDLALTNQDANTVSVLLGNGNGTFGAKTDFGTGLTPNAIATGDIDRDGDLDLAVANSADDTVSILRNTPQPAPSADLTITKTDSPDPVKEGSNLTYTITVTNSGPDTATNVFVTDTLPSGVTFVSSSASPGSCSGTSTVTCNLGTINSGSNATVTLVITPTAAGPLSNTASVSTSVTDPDNTNDSATENTTVNPVQADLVLAKTDSPDPVTVGNNLTYTITVTNSGPDTATNVVVTDTLPGGVTFDFVSPSEGSCSGTSTVTCNLGAISNGNSATIDIRVTPTTAGTLSNTANVTSSVTDPDNTDNGDTESTTVNAAAGGGGGDGNGICSVAAAYGSPRAPQVQLLREFRDRYLLPHPGGQAFVALYYTLSPPLAAVIASSEVFRAAARVAMAPIVAWAALVLWSPSVGLVALVCAFRLGAWLVLRIARRRRWAGSRRRATPRTKGWPSTSTLVPKRLTIWVCLLFALAGTALLEADQGERSQAETRIEFKGEVRLPQATRFAILRDQGTGHLGLYRDGEAVFRGEESVLLGKIVAVLDHALVIAVPSQQKIEIPQGAEMPGPHGLIFVRSALIDTLRYQVRFGVAATPGGDYTLLGIVGRRAILQRDAGPGQDQATADPLVVPEPPRGSNRVHGPGGPRPAPETGTLAELVDRTSFTEVAPDTWEVPRQSVKQFGNHLGPLLTETLRSASPTVTMKGGVGLKLHNSLGSGTLDRRGFKIGYAKMAQRTGLEVGDRILFVNGQPVNSIGGLVRIYRKLKSDPNLSEVNVVIKRGEEVKTLRYRFR